MKITNDDLEFLQDLLKDKLEIKKYFQLKNLINKLIKQIEKIEKEKEEDKRDLVELILKLEDNQKIIIRSIISQYNKNGFITSKQLQILRNELTWVDYGVIKMEGMR